MRKLALIVVGTGLSLFHVLVAFALWQRYDRYLECKITGQSCSSMRIDGCSAFHKVLLRADDEDAWFVVDRSEVAAIGFPVGSYEFNYRLVSKNGANLGEGRVQLDPKTVPKALIVEDCGDRCCLRDVERFGDAPDAQKR
jgi:hypothetical protein